jgi:hypothetical protein
MIARSAGLFVMAGRSANLAEVLVAGSSMLSTALSWPDHPRMRRVSGDNLQSPRILPMGVAANTLLIWSCMAAIT